MSKALSSGIVAAVLTALIGCAVIMSIVTLLMKFGA